MANTDLAIGFIPQDPSDDKKHPYEVSSSNSTAILKGAPVKLSGGYLVNASAGNYLRGIAADYIAASTAKADFMVWDDPFMVFKAQADEADLTAANVGQNLDFISTKTSANGVDSAVELDSSTIATTNTLGFKLQGLSREVDLGAGADNAWGAHAKVLVTINLHEKRYTTGIG